MRTCKCTYAHRQWCTCTQTHNGRTHPQTIYTGPHPFATEINLKNKKWKKDNSRNNWNSGMLNGQCRLYSIWNQVVISWKAHVHFIDPLTDTHLGFELFQPIFMYLIWRKERELKLEKPITFIEFLHKKEIVFWEILYKHVYKSSGTIVIAEGWVKSSRRHS